MKEYLYIAGDKIKLWSNNLAVKMEAVRQNQDEILKVRDSVESLVKESGDVVKSIEKTVDNIGGYDTGEIRDISDIGGIKKLVADLEESKNVVQQSIKKSQTHIDNVEKTAENLLEATKEIEESEKAISELNELDKDISKVSADAQKHIDEDELKKKDQTASNATNTSPEEATEDCPLKCKLDYFTIEDSSGRKIAFENDIQATEQNPENTEEENKEPPPPPTTLYVICGDKKGYTEEITISSHGNCKSGSTCPVVSMNGGAIDETQAQNIQKIKLTSVKTIPEKSWADFIRKVIVPDMNVLSEPVKYEVNVHDCDKKDDISDLKIISFPPAGWKGNVTVKYTDKSDEEKKKIRSSNIDKGFMDAEPMGDWEFGCSMECYIDEVTWKFAPPDEFLTSVQDCMNKIAPLFNEIENDYGKITIGWPNIELDGNVDLAEVPDYYQLSYQGSITLKADPFLKLNVDVNIKNIIQRILSETSLFGKFLDEILIKAEEGFGNRYVGGKANIGVMLKTEAEIHGDLNWQREPSEGKWKVDTEKCKVGGSMGITIYGDVNVEGHMFSVQAAAGASLHVLSHDGKDLSRFSMTWMALEGMENPSLQRQMGFNGLAIYYSAYAELGVDETEAGNLAEELLGQEQEVDVRGSDEDSNEDEAETTVLLETGDRELKELCKLMDPWSSVDETSEIGKDAI